jgi:hypothetical protein
MKVVAAFIGVLAVVVLIGLVGWQLSECRKRLDTLEAKFAEQTNIANEHSRLLGAAKSFEKGLVGEVADHSTMLRDIAKSVPTPGAGPERFAVNLKCIMDNAGPRGDFENAVTTSISRDSGELRIKNDTISEQRVRVNGDKWFALPSGGRLNFAVPRGNVIAETEADGAKTWFIGPPDYRQELVIKPRVPDDPRHVDGMVVPRSPVAP